MDQQQWLNWRKIGSSDAPVIMGVSPYSTPYQLWDRIVSKKQLEENSAMRRGKEMEEEARRWFEKKMGTEVFPKCVEHPSVSFMTATLDGIDLENKIMVEIKCPKKEFHEMAVQGKVPDCYFPQVQHQLEVTGLPSMFYLSFDGTNGALVEVEKDDEYIQNMIIEEEKFWRNIVEQTAPELNERDFVQQGEEWVALAKKKWDLQQQGKLLEDEEKRIDKELKALSADACSRGGGFRYTRFMSKGLVDYKSIPELSGVNLDVYRSAPSVRWRLSVDK